ncbi:hypothetical protein G9A89_016180 [Geosiphon pyriformis]|nr:hypothetical protein G9A89_016180 [Geosiphon pyriformis]
MQKIQDALKELILPTYQLSNSKSALLVNNATSHHTQIGENSFQLTNITLYYFPSNTTSHLQPMDADIIKSFKGKYKHLYCQHILHQFEQKINIEHLITPVTIQNCWQKTDILFYNQELEIQESETSIAMDIFNNLPSNAQQLVKNLEDYTLADAQIETNTINDSEEELEESPPAIITITEAYEALKKGN